MAEQLPRTYRTLLLEKFRDDKNHDLSQLILKGKSAGLSSSDIYMDMLKKLEVHSFTEFLERFAPLVYEEVDKKTGKINYRTVKELAGDEEDIRPIAITEHTYYRMLRRLYERKAVSGESNNVFETQDIKDMLKAEQERKEITKMRKQLEVQRDAYLEAKQAGKDTMPFKQAIVEIRQRAAEKYQSSAINLLPPALEMVENRIKSLEANKIKLLANPDQPLTDESTISRPVFDENGHIAVQEIPIAAAKQQQQQVQLLSIGRMIEKDYDRAIEAAGDKENKFMKSLVVAAFSPDTVRESDFSSDEFNNLPVEEKEARINAQLTTCQDLLDEWRERYTEAKKNFVKEMNRTLEKLLGVRTLFDLATKDGGEDGYLQDGIIVANCKLEELLDEDIQPTLLDMLKVTSVDVNQKIWFAAIPAIDEKATHQKANKAQAQMFDDFGDEEDDTPLPPVDSFGEDNVDDLKKAIETFGKANIMTIFSYRGSKETGFAKLTAKTIKDTFDKIQRYGIKDELKDHVSYAFPNFTLLNENETVNLFEAYEKAATNMNDLDYDPETGEAVLHKEIVAAKSLTLPGFYIEAAYPAVGLLIRSQQQECLRQAGLNVDDKLECVRVDLATPEVQKCMTTNFTRENLLRWNQGIHDAINDAPYAFIFCGDKLVLDGKEVKNTYVYRTNALSGKPISNVLFEDYIRCKCKEWGEIETTVGKELHTLKTKWVMESNRMTNVVNKMLKEDEDISMVQIDPGSSKKKIQIKISKRPNIVRDIDIETKEEE